MATAQQQQQQHNKLALMRVESSLHRLRQHQEEIGMRSVTAATNQLPTSSIRTSFQCPSTHPLPPPPP